jgi:hypothetical protein
MIVVSLFVFYVVCPFILFSLLYDLFIMILTLPFLFFRDEMTTKYIMNNFVAIDQRLNALLFGEIDETISSRLGKAKRGDFGKKWKVVLTPIANAVDVVFRLIEGEWNHCTRHIEEDEGDDEILLKK